MDVIDQYFAEVETAIRTFDRAALRAVVDVLFACWQRRGTAWICGNGGSASTASHVMTDLHKCTIVPGAERFRAIALTDNASIITMIGNDYGFEDVFVEPLRAHLDPGDVVLAISGSGNSPNVLRAIAYAKECGALTIGYCGTAHGKLASLVDAPVVFPAPLIGQQEDGHLMFNHAVALALKAKIAAAVPVTAPA